MNDRNTNREKKKSQLRRQIVDERAGLGRFAEGPGSEEIVRQAEKKVKKKRLRIFLIIIVLLAAAVFGVFQYIRYFQFTDYKVVWENKLTEGSYVGYLNYGDNVLKYSRDGASYIDAQGKEIWTESYEMKSPQAVVNGDYAAIADIKGSQNVIYIFDKSGKKGVATPSKPILKVTVSAFGVVAALLEDSSATYTNYFRSDGVALDIESGKMITGEVGFPLDISVSPDGTQLLGSYLSLRGGVITSNVTFYNFDEVGKNKDNRLVGSFSDIHPGLVVPRVAFFTDVYSFSIASNGISFYSSKNVLSPEQVKFQPIDNTIRSVFYSRDYLGVITIEDGINESRMDIYHSNGSQVFSEKIDYPYRYADIDGDNVILYNEDSCKIYNMSGIEKFSGTFDFPVTKIRRGKYPNILIVSGPQDMKEIKLQ